MLASASGTGTPAHPLGVLGEEIGYGLIGGVSAGLLAGYIVVLAGRRGLIDDDWRQLIPVAGATLAFGVAEALGGSGFIAAFVAGVLFGLIVRSDTAKTMGYTQRTGALLDAVTFLVFRAVLLGPALETLSWQIVLYALLSLTVVGAAPHPMIEDQPAYEHRARMGAAG